MRAFRLTPDGYLADPAADLSAAALDLDAGWPEHAPGIRTVAVSHAVLVRARGYLGVLHGRFLIGAPGAAPALVGPGELLPLSAAGLTARAVSAGRLVVLHDGDGPAVEDVEAEPLPDNGLPADYYHGYADRYEEVYRRGGLYWEPPEPNEILLAVLAGRGIRGGRVIDLGCGEGRDSVHLAGQGFDVLGVDVSAAALGLARSRAEAAGVPARFLERDVTALRGIPDGHFDLAINMGCLHMMPDAVSRSRHLRRVHDVLRPGGTFVLAHCREKWLHGFWSVPDAEAVGTVRPGDVIDRRIRTAGGTATIPLEVVPYAEASEDALIAECTAAGFRTVDVGLVDAEAFGNTAVLVLEK
jgi:SAM-dependent methyltransferase